MPKPPAASDCRRSEHSRARRHSVWQNARGNAKLPTISCRTAPSCQRRPRSQRSLASADVEKGRTYFTRACDRCHNAEPLGGNKTGPNLWSAVGRDKVSTAKMRYSDALLSWEGVWTYEDLNRFLFGPMLTTPGVKMEIPGVSDETERVNLIAYLRTLSDKPMPL
ncbi:c-type cytochrome [Mesorhizobium sp. M0213]|uniref:c-type cytochrome n=1 Tax=Mesorhizobium sp. M0213 TaxID=2956917 RepID=UPI003337D8F3